jgi:hypothetical protein
LSEAARSVNLTGSRRGFSLRYGNTSGPDANVLRAGVNQFSTKSPISRLPVAIGARYTLCCGATNFVRLPAGITCQISKDSVEFNNQLIYNGL